MSRARKATIMAIGLSPSRPRLAGRDASPGQGRVSFLAAYSGSKWLKAVQAAAIVSDGHAATDGVNRTN